MNRNSRTNYNPLQQAAEMAYFEGPREHKHTSEKEEEEQVAVEDEDVSDNEVEEYKGDIQASLQRFKLNFATRQAQKSLLNVQHGVQSHNSVISLYSPYVDPVIRMSTQWSFSLWRFFKVFIYMLFFPIMFLVDVYTQLRNIIGKPKSRKITYIKELLQQLHFFFHKDSDLMHVLYKHGWLCEFALLLIYTIALSSLILHASFSDGYWLYKDHQNEIGLLGAFDKAEAYVLSFEWLLLSIMTAGSIALEVPGSDEVTLDQVETARSKKLRAKKCYLITKGAGGVFVHKTDAHEVIQKVIPLQDKVPRGSVTFCIFATLIFLASPFLFRLIAPRFSALRVPVLGLITGKLGVIIIIEYCIASLGAFLVMYLALVLIPYRLMKRRHRSIKMGYLISYHDDLPDDYFLTVDESFTSSQLPLDIADNVWAFRHIKEYVQSYKHIQQVWADGYLGILVLAFALYFIYALVKLFFRDAIEIDFSTIFATYCTFLLFLAISYNAFRGAKINDISKVHRKTLLQWRETVSMEALPSNPKLKENLAACIDALDVSYRHLVEASTYDFRLWGIYLDTYRLVSYSWVTITVLAGYVTSVAPSLVGSFSK